MATKRHVGYWGIHINEGEEELFRKIDMARKARGMSRKGFILHGIANMCPELTTQIVEFLLSRSQARDKKAVVQQMEINSDD